MKKTVRNVARRTVVAMRKAPIYRFIPVASVRDYAALQHLDSKGPDAVVDYVKETGRLPDLRPSTMRIASQAAAAAGDTDLAVRISKGGHSALPLDHFKRLLAQGDDAAVERLASEMIERYPEATAPHLALSDLRAFQGDYSGAFECARRARLLSPHSSNAAAREVRLSYLLDDLASADDLALAALERFPSKADVVWAACKGCSSEAQYERLVAVWRQTVARPAHVMAGVRPFANAAMRAERFDDAIALYAEACVYLLRGDAVGGSLPVKELRGKGAVSVIDDIASVLDDLGVPFFIAAGTALGVVRDGKPLDHDNDIDIGVWDADYNREALLKAFTAHPNFDLDKPHPSSPKVGLVHRRGVVVDIFRFYEEDGRIFHDGVFVRWFNVPFVTAARDVGGREIHVPEPADDYLTDCYGDWRVPDPTFEAFVDAPNVEVVWPEYLAAHRVRRAYRFIRELDLLSASHECAAIRPELTRSVAGRSLLEEMSL